MKRLSVGLFLFLTFSFFSCDKESNIEPEISLYPGNEAGANQDFLTPTYYTSPSTSFHNAVDEFIYFARRIEHQHPLLGPDGGQAPYQIPMHGAFGAGKGFNNSSEHHPASDIYLGNGNDDSPIYALHSGEVRSYRDSDKYRHYLTISTEVHNDEGVFLGQIVSVYAHIDLDKDEAGGLFLNETHVEKGDVVSEHLYANTTGGAHLHFEIRYYRPEDDATLEFYGWSGADASYTEPSAGIWSYGYWNPDIGYGYANPLHYGVE